MASGAATTRCGVLDALAEKYASYMDDPPDGPLLGLRPERVLFWRASEEVPKAKGLGRVRLRDMSPSSREPRRHRIDSCGRGAVRANLDRGGLARGSKKT